MKKIAIALLLMTVCAWAQAPSWQARLRYIEACSCDLFCPCYFNDHASHQGTGEHSCTFNMATRVEAGKYGDLDLTGLKFWLSGDLGPEWGTKGQADWLVATFEPSITPQQKDAMMAVLTKVYPVKWKSVQFDSSAITWKMSPDGKTAEAKLANGKADMKLTRFGGGDAEKPSQVTNVKYFGATWNSPFNLYYSDHRYDGFGKKYSLKHANGFTVVVEMTSDGKPMEKKAPAPKKGASD